MAYKPQFYPSATKVAENRRNHINPAFELEKLREIPDEDVVKIMGHRQPSEDYKTVHPPLEEMDLAEDYVRDLVGPINGAKEGHRIRYIQFADSMYFAPSQPYDRSRLYMSRFRGVDCGTLSGRQVVELRESNLEDISKNYLVDTELFDPATTGMRGATVHGHSLRLDENGVMFDALQRYEFDEATGHILYVKDQVGRPWDEPVDVGEPVPQEKLKEITTIYRKDGVAMRDDMEVVEVVKRIHRARTLGGYCPLNEIFDTYL
uniref:Methyl-coenzyme M reductase subunit gamma n=1 Tax=Methanococcus voltae TaxID=2188 RepID=MCRG_METVO|nr:RecName: Full=Methyl-coenzyme M reductase subunit gamma; AltName: Full=Coenzyme-B sulfoethylthiotransferase gamma [Methanococcus voltae]CAA30632.1 mcrG [Methanococcus voltae PS]prf//1515346D methyl coenzyme M reductase gamma [Methanococcus voltae]